MRAGGAGPAVPSSHQMACRSSDSKIRIHFLNIREKNSRGAARREKSKASVIVEGCSDFLPKVLRGFPVSSFLNAVPSLAFLKRGRERSLKKEEGKKASTRSLRSRPAAPARPLDRCFTAGAEPPSTAPAANSLPLSHCTAAARALVCAPIQPLLARVARLPPGCSPPHPTLGRNGQTILRLRLAGLFPAPPAPMSTRHEYSGYRPTVVTVHTNANES